MFPTTSLQVCILMLHGIHVACGLGTDDTSVGRRLAPQRSHVFWHNHSASDAFSDHALVDKWSCILRREPGTRARQSTAKNWQIQSLGDSRGSSAVSQRFRATNAPDRFGFMFKDDFRSTQNIFPVALADLDIIWHLTDVSFQQCGKCSEQIRCLLHSLSLQVLRGSLSSCVLYQQDSAVECSVCVFPYAFLLKCMFDRLHRRCVMLSSSSQSCPLTQPGMSLRLSTFHDLARLITVMAPRTRQASLSLDTRLILYGQNWHTIIISLFSCRSLEDAPCSSCSSESSRSLL